jgi:uncharacterized membrane protein
MIIIDHWIDVEIPVRAAYAQWTRFEEFPSFMEGVEEVRRLDGTRLVWRANFAGAPEEWLVEVDDLQRDRRVAWHKVAGRLYDVSVCFESVRPNQTRVLLHMEYELWDILEDVGATRGRVGERVREDLQRFKTWVERRLIPSEV